MVTILLMAARFGRHRACIGAREYQPFAAQRAAPSPASVRTAMRSPLDASVHVG